MFKKKIFVSLTAKLLITLSLAFALAMGVFFSAREIGNFLVWRYYLADEIKEERAEQYIKDLNDFVFEHKLSVNDGKRVAQWLSNKPVDIILYKDSDLIYAPDWFASFEEKDTETGTADGRDTSEELESEGAEETDDAESDAVASPEDESETFDYEDGSESEGSGETETETDASDDIILGGWFSGDRGFEQYLTADARERYFATLDSILEGNAEMEPIYFVDGTMLATVVDTSENALYNLVFAISMILAIAVVAIIMTINLTRLSRRVKRLAHKVRAVESGTLDMPIKLDGNDELASLAADVNSMRDAVVDNMTKEKQAWEANATLITSMSHDIRTPLTVLMGYLDLIELGKNDEENREYITACKDNALRLKLLSDDMFSYFTAFGKKDVELNMSYHLLSDSVGQMIAEHVFLLQENGYTVEGGDSLPEVGVNIDAMYFGRVIGNVFSNIQKYARRDVPIRITSSVSGGDVILEITNAIEENPDRAQSTGIGLKTCERIMTRTGGKFETENDGENYKVTITLPTVEEEGKNDT